jgi:hypothetical protein
MRTFSGASPYVIERLGQRSVSFGDLRQSRVSSAVDFEEGVAVPDFPPPCECAGLRRYFFAEVFFKLQAGHMCPPMPSS